jgi:hypothetical protein
VIEVHPDNADQIRSLFGDDAVCIGSVCDHNSLTITTLSQVFSWTGIDMADAWTSTSFGHRGAIQ